MYRNKLDLQTKRADQRVNGGWIHSCTRHCGACNNGLYFFSPNCTGCVFSVQINCTDISQSLLTTALLHAGSQLLNIDGFTATTALETLLAGGATVPKQSLFLQDKTYPCTACCDDEDYPPASRLGGQA